MATGDFIKENYSGAFWRQDTINALKKHKDGLHGIETRLIKVCSNPITYIEVVVGSEKEKKLIEGGYCLPISSRIDDESLTIELDIDF